MKQQNQRKTFLVKTEKQALHMRDSLQRDGVDVRAEVEELCGPVHGGCDDAVVARVEQATRDRARVDVCNASSLLFPHVLLSDKILHYTHCQHWRSTRH